MIQDGYLGLFCDNDECADDEYAEPEFLEYGFESKSQLRKHAAEHGWVHAPDPGRPWGEGEDFCPRHHPPAQIKPEGTIEIKG